MEERLNEKIDFMTLALIVILVLVFGIFYFFYNFKFEDHTVESTPLNSAQQKVINPIPQTIRKTEEIIAAENEVRVSRSVKLNKDRSVTVVASLKGLSNIPEGVVLNDFHEEIRLGKHVNVLSGNVAAANGSLFPSDNKVSVSSYGPGPKDKKSTSINITLLDLNFDQKAHDTKLYELNFVPDVSVSELNFAAAEIRSGKYILGFKEEGVKL